MLHPVEKGLLLMSKPQAPSAFLPLQAQISAKTDLGKVRGNNEDAYYADGIVVTAACTGASATTNRSVRAPFVVCVCDGMGGEDSGEVASAVAVTTLNEFRSCILGAEDTGAAIKEYVRTVNERLCAKTTINGKTPGTTAALLCSFDHKVVAANIGDSRIYRFSSGVLTQISTDHTEVRLQVRAGILTEEQAKTSSNRHKLTQHLGIPEHEMLLDPEIVLVDNPGIGDVFLLCSDGLTDMVEDRQIERILREEPDIQTATDRLINTALQNGGRDNVTVLLTALRKADADIPSPAVPGEQKAQKAAHEKTTQRTVVVLAVIALAAMIMILVLGDRLLSKRDIDKEPTLSSSTETVSLNERVAVPTNNP